MGFRTPTRILGERGPLIRKRRILGQWRRCQQRRGRHRRTGAVICNRLRLRIGRRPVDDCSCGRYRHGRNGIRRGNGRGGRDHDVRIHCRKCRRGQHLLAGGVRDRGNRRASQETRSKAPCPHIAPRVMRRRFNLARQGCSERRYGDGGIQDRNGRRRQGRDLDRASRLEPFRLFRLFRHWRYAAHDVRLRAHTALLHYASKFIGIPLTAHHALKGSGLIPGAARATGFAPREDRNGFGSSPSGRRDSHAGAVAMLGRRHSHEGQGSPQASFPRWHSRHYSAS